MAKAVRRSAPSAPSSTLSNALELLKSFSDEEYRLDIGELASRLPLTENAVQQLVSVLVEADLLEQDGHTGKCNLGLALLEIGVRKSAGHEGRGATREAPCPVRASGGDQKGLERSQMGTGFVVGAAVLDLEAFRAGKNPSGD